MSGCLFGVTRSQGNPRLRHAYGQLGLEENLKLINCPVLQEACASDISGNIRTKAAKCVAIRPRILAHRTRHENDLLRDQMQVSPREELSRCVTAVLTKCSPR